ncbi:hypothetical protein AUK22_01815 [bacterium CG2_30_54_10]|nr:MAG: hypothetical protein AUK22_01815 [bacterium CG2_30_54_10]
MVNPRFIFSRISTLHATNIFLGCPFFSPVSKILMNANRNFSKKGGTRECHLDKEILEKNARNKIRVHQCLPIVEKILEKPK